MGELQQFAKLRHNLTVDDNLVLYQARIVVPTAARSDVLVRLHASHQGMVRTKQRARQTVYWPGLSNDIVKVIQNCRSCQELHASQSSEPFAMEPSSSRVFEDTSANFCCICRQLLPCLCGPTVWLAIAACVEQT